MDDNPHANILAVAANDVAFLKQNIPEVVDEERGEIKTFIMLTSLAISPKLTTAILVLRATR